MPLLQADIETTKAPELNKSVSRSPFLNVESDASWHRPLVEALISIETFLSPFHF